MKLDELKIELERRQSNRQQIQDQINEWAFKEYRIFNFYEKYLNPFLSSINDNNIGLCLCRQLATPNIEFLSIEILSHILANQGLPIVSFPMLLQDDSYSALNNIKLSYVKKGILKKTRKGGFCLTNEAILPKDDYSSLNGTVLRYIKTKYGNTLPEYHSNLISLTGLKNNYPDINSIYTPMLKESILNGNFPYDFYYKEKDSKKARRYREDSFEIWFKKDVVVPNKILRPELNWYFPFCLAMFLDGRLILVEGVDSDQPKIQALFAKTIKKLSQITGGFEPLIIYEKDLITFNKPELNLTYTSNGLEIPEWCFRDDLWLPKTIETVNFDPNKNTISSLFEACTYSLFEQILAH